MIKFKKSLAVMMLSAVLITAASCAKTNNEGGGSTPTQDIIDPFLEGTDIFIGDTVTITPREIEKDGEYYPCYDFYTITPDGNRLSGDKQYISVAGQYETVFMAKMDDGSFITDSDTFIAYERAFSVEKETSSTQYVDKVKGDFNNTTPGITATLVEGDTWHYNQIIDISGSSLAKPIIKFYSSPMSEFINGDVSPFIDATKQILRISDYYDPTNYIDVQIGYFLANQGTGRMQTYAVAGSTFQSATGLMANSRAWGTRRDVTIDGIDYACCFGFDDFGCTMGTTPGWKSNRHPEESTDPTKPYFNPDITNSDGFGYSVFYDSATKRIYIQHNNLYFVTDLDEPIIYNDNVFKGFTTGEVTLSLHFDAYKSSSATFEITEIYGKTGEELKEMKAIDNKAPEIYVDCQKDSFYIARNEEFAVPSATARDAHLKEDVQVEVIYDKGSSSERYITVVDGKFTPTEVGEYTIVYTAHDTFNNKATKEIKCQAIVCADDRLVDFNYSEVNDTPAGATIQISKPTISSANGEEGLYANLYIVDPNGEQTEFDALKDSVSYLLRRVGKYKVIYEYGDIAKSYVEEYEFNSEASQNIYLDTTYFPNYFIKGSKVSLDDNKAVLCDTASVHYIKTKIEAKVDDGDYQEVTDINNYEVIANNKIKLRYSYEGTPIYETNEIPVIDVGFNGSLDLKQYFQSSSAIEKTLTPQDIELKTSYSDEINFINPLSFSNFSIKLNLLNRDKFEKFSIILKDYYDPSNIISFDFSYHSPNLILTVNDYSVSLGDTSSISLSYSNATSSIYYDVSSSFTLISPFANDKFCLSFKFTNPTTDVGLKLSSLLNQYFNSSITKDTTQPLLISNNLAGYYSLDDIIKIEETHVCDVLSPYINNKHKLIANYQTSIDSTKEPVRSVDDILLDGNETADCDYHVALSKYGVYTLIYSYTDQFDNVAYRQNVLYVVDDKAPVITIEGATSSTIDTCGLNDEVKVRNATVQDESECTIVIYVISPSSVLSKANDNKFKANEKGLWKVLYYAADAVGNIGTAYYQVNCK